MNLNESIPCGKMKVISESCNDDRFNMIYSQACELETELIDVTNILVQKINSLIGVGDTLRKEVPGSQKESMDEEAWLDKVIQKQRDCLSLIIRLTERAVSL